MMTTTSKRILSPGLIHKLVEAEILKYKELKLDASDETTGLQTHYGTGAPKSGWKVRFYRERYTGSDGVVRATRLRNQEPCKPPKDSEYARLFSAFAGMRHEGASAKWNIEADSFNDFLCTLTKPVRVLNGHGKGEQPIIAHCHIKQDYNWFYPTTSLTWSQDWSSVLDCVDIYTFNGGEEIAERHLVKNGFNFVKKVVDGDLVTFNLIFRGDGNAPCASHWSWRSNAISGEYTDPPALTLNEND